MSLLARLSLANRGLVALIAVVITAVRRRSPCRRSSSSSCRRWSSRARSSSPTYPGASPEVVEQQVTEPHRERHPGHRRAVEGQVDHPRGLGDGPGRVRVRHRPRQRRQPDADRDQPDPSAAARRRRPDGLRGQHRRPAGVVLAAPIRRRRAGAGRPAAAPGRARAPGHRRRPHRRGHRRPRADRADHARSRRSWPPPGDPADRARRRRCRPTASPSPPARSPTTTRRCAVQVGTPIDSLDALKDLYLHGSPRPRHAGPAGRRRRRSTRSSPRPPRSPAPTAPTASASRSSRTPGRQRGATSPTRSATSSPTSARAVDTELTVVFDQAPFVEKSIDSLTTEGLLGLVMAVIVILVFLLSVRSTLVTAVSIPLSVLVALIALYARRLLAQPAHPRRADHRGRPGRRRLDRRAGEHQTTSGVRRERSAPRSSPAYARCPARSPRRR